VCVPRNVRWRKKARAAGRLKWPMARREARGCGVLMTRGEHLQDKELGGRECRPGFKSGATWATSLCTSIIKGGSLWPTRSRRRSRGNDAQNRGGTTLCTGNPALWEIAEKESSRVKGATRSNGRTGPGTVGKTVSKETKAKAGFSEVGAGKRIGDTRPAAVGTVGADCDGDGDEAGNERRLDFSGGNQEGEGGGWPRIIFISLAQRRTGTMGRGVGCGKGATGQERQGNGESSRLSLAGSLAFSGVRPPVGPNSPGGCPGSTTTGS